MYLYFIYIRLILKMSNKQLHCFNFEKRAILYEEQINGTYKCFDGKKYQIHTINEFRQERNARKCIFISKLAYSKTNDTMEQAYAHFMHIWEVVKKETLGLVNLRKTALITRSTVQLFYDYINGRDHVFLNHPFRLPPITPPKIQRTEGLAINDACQKAFIWGCDYYKGPAYKYDVNSFYAWLLQSPNLLIPIDEPELKVLSQDDLSNLKYFMIGLYHCRIEHTNEKTPKLFQTNPRHWYTHYEMTYAKELGLQMQILTDGHPNLLFYARQKCKTAKELFFRVTDMIYNRLKMHKEKEIQKIGKGLLARLWGALKEKKMNTYVLKMDDLINKPEKCEIDPTKPGIEIQVLANGDVKVEYQSDDMFKSPWARVAPFLLAKGRIEISKIYAPYIDHIKRVHTDGFHSDIELPIKLSTVLGGMKIEKKYNNCILSSTTAIDLEDPNDDKKLFRFITAKDKQDRKYLQRIKNKYCI